MVVMILVVAWLLCGIVAWNLVKTDLDDLIFQSVLEAMVYGVGFFITVGLGPVSLLLILFVSIVKRA